MGKVDMGGMGSSTMELMGSVFLLHVLRVPFLQNGQESLLFQVFGVPCIFLGRVSLMAG